MNHRSLAFLHHPELDRLAYPADCPFKTQRAGMTRQRLRSFGLLGLDGRVEVEARRATRAELETLHAPAYLDELQRAAAGELTVEGLHHGLGAPDTPVFPDLYEYGAWAAGAALTAADLLVTGAADVAFHLSGGFHHAMADRAGGFCYVNDIALACHRLAATGRRVAYVDLDAHHGDGVQAAFYRRADVLTVSLHESGTTLYPWGGFETELGEGPGLGFNVNVPLPAGTYDEAFLRAYRTIVVPVLAAYAPEVIVVELGMDILAGDPLAHLHVTNNVVVEVMEHLMRTGRPLLVSGGGGYHPDNTVRGWALAWRTCCGEGDEDIYSLGLGGVMLGSSEWAGGLRDHARVVTEERRQTVDTALARTLAQLQRDVPLLQSITAGTAAAPQPVRAPATDA